MPRERVAPQFDVIRAVMVDDSPYVIDNNGNMAAMRCDESKEFFDDSATQHEGEGARGLPRHSTIAWKAPSQGRHHRMEGTTHRPKRSPRRAATGRLH